MKHIQSYFTRSVRTHNVNNNEKPLNEKVYMSSNIFLPLLFVSLTYFKLPLTLEILSITNQS